MMDFYGWLTIEIIRSITGLILLVLTWMLGQRILISWDLRKKRHELDIAASGDFNALYGEFKEVSKLWRILEQRRAEPWIHEQTSRWDLLTRACAIESKYEALLVKLVTERFLDIDQLQLLGLLRQSLQQPREAIRDNKPLTSSSRGPEYMLLNLLAARVSEVINSRHTTARPSAERAASGLQAIAAISLQEYRGWIDNHLSRYSDRTQVNAGAAKQPDLLSALSTQHQNSG